MKSRLHKVRGLCFLAVNFAATISSYIINHPDIISNYNIIEYIDQLHN